MPLKRILLLANSRKHAERCLAGREIHGDDLGDWIRPVSARLGEGINDHERAYAGGGEPALLDILDIPLGPAVPHACHVENWRINDNLRWTKRGSMSWNKAAALAESPPALWVNGHHTYNGVNDEIPSSRWPQLANSLCMIRVPNVTIHVFRGYTGDRKLHASFRFAGVNYRFSTTDVLIEAEYKNGAIGDFELGEALLTLSLSEPFTKNGGEQCKYKLVAAIIVSPGF